MRKYRPKGRKGIGTVVTSIMLVSAVSMLGAALVSWSSSNFALQQAGVAEEIDDRVNQLSEGFIIEDVWFYSDTGIKYATVTVRNTGNVAVTISNIYLNKTQVWSDSHVIPRSETGAITFEADWSDGSPQNIWIRTERGTDAKQLWRA